MRDEDEKFMRFVFELVKCGEGWINLNLMVGVVIVKDGKIIGVGWYRKFGEKYVEINVIEDVKVKGYDVRGVMMYVMFEFCFYWGK